MAKEKAEKYDDKNYVQIPENRFFSSHVEQILQFYDDGKKRPDFLAGDIIEDLTYILSFEENKTDDEREIKLGVTMMKEGIHQRIADRYLFSKRSLKIIPYFQNDIKKSGYADRINRKKIDFDWIGIKMLPNFLRLTFQQEFSEDSLHEFLKDSVQSSFPAVKYQVDSYLDTREDDDFDDEEDDDEDTLLLSLPIKEPQPWHAYMLASSLLWKSTTYAELCTAVELLHEAEQRVQDVFSAWQYESVMTEFQSGGGDALDDHLRKITCDTAYHYREELVDKLNDNDESSRDEWLLTLYANVILYMKPGDSEEKSKTLYALYTIYDDLRSSLQEGGGSPNDIEFDNDES